MTPFLWIVVAVVVLALIGGILYLVMGSSSNSAQAGFSSQRTAAPETGPVVPPATELKIEEVKPGDGAKVAHGKTVSVHYTGWLSTGKKIDSSHDRGKPFQFRLGAGKVILGWDKGVVGMKPGGKRRLIVPPQLGYGKQGNGKLIPPHSTLVFDVELVSIQ